MVQNIIDISVLKAEIPGNTLPLSLSPDLCTIQKPPRSKYKFNFTLYLPRERERDVRIVREDTQNLPVMVWFNFSPQYDEVMSLTIILSDFDWD